MSNALLVRNADGLQVEVIPAIEQRKIDALNTSKTITAVDSSFDQQDATDARIMLKTLLKDVESSRKLVKEPVLIFAKKIDSIAAKFVSEIEAEEMRIGKLLNAYQSELEREESERLEKIRREQQEREAELRRIETERIRKEREVQAERERLEREQFASESAAEQAKIQAQIDTKKAEEEDAKVIAKTQTRLVLESAPIATAQVAKPQQAIGLQAKKMPKYEVLDIIEVLGSDPDLVEITIKHAEVLKKIRAGMSECKGMRIWWETETNVRV